MRIILNKFTAFILIVLLAEQTVLALILPSFSATGDSTTIDKNVCRPDTTLSAMDRASVLRSVWFGLTTPLTIAIPESFAGSTDANSNTEEFTDNKSRTSNDIFSTTSTTTTTSSCGNGVLVPEQAIPGAYMQPCMNLPERTIPLSIPPKFDEGLSDNNRGNDKQGGSDEKYVITIRQEASGSGRTGMAVWNSGLLLTRLLERIAAKYPRWWNQHSMSVIELGCGTGIASIAAYKLGAKHVLATDGNPDVIRLTQSNIQLNQQLQDDSRNDDKENNNQQRTLRANVLQWGLLDAIEYSDDADLVLGADLTYNSGSWRVLAETMSTIIKPNGYILYLSLGHEGFNVNAEVDGFLSVAKETGLVLVDPSTVDVTSDGTTSDNADMININTIIGSITSPTEQKLLQQSGGAKVLLLKRKVLGRKK